ncbi:MAG: hypothetical protein HQL06_11440 [Nitrospirae bacterium]|nr:hypothetical protein [Nitrospirota bacterium]
MSGPKKADVEAQLNISRGIQRKCEAIISRAEDAAISRLILDVEGLMRDADTLANSVRTEIGSITADMRRIAPDSVGVITDAAAKTQRNLDDARASLSSAREAVNNASISEDKARGIFEEAEAEYKRALSAVRNAGDHYLHTEMEWARRATELYNSASKELNEASRARTEAQDAATTALQLASETKSAMQDISTRVQSTKNEATARLRAQEDAKKIAEQKQREAVIAIEGARAAIIRIIDMPHDRFRPGGMGEIQQEMESAMSLFNGGRFDEARAKAERIHTEAARLEKEVVEATREFQRRRTEAESHVIALDAILSETDESLINQWADTPDTIQKARSALASAREDIKSERFEDAGKMAIVAKDSITQALRSAVDNKGADENRSTIGKAVIEALQEMGFDTSFEYGTRTEPMRISGQTPDVSGKGDFDIAIPLDGNVDFEVDTYKSDTSCIATVQTLQKRLAERGIMWNTTNWGHAEGTTIRNVTQTTQSAVEKVKIRRRNK